MDINLTNTHELIRLFVDGELKAEIVVGRVTTETDLLQEVSEARMLQCLPKLFRQMLKEYVRRQAKDREKFLVGLGDGFHLKTIQHPLPGVPEIRPDYDPHYGEGYSIGEAIARIQSEVDKENP